MINDAGTEKVIIKQPRVILSENPAIHAQRMQEIKDYVKGAVHAYTNNNRGKAFMAHDLFGGENTDWEGTPLKYLYEARVKAGSPNPKKAAGQDVGWILLSVLHDDKQRTFIKEKGRWAIYRKEG